MNSSGCVTGRIVAEAPAHCVTKDETFRYMYVTAEKIAIFKPTEEGVPTQFFNLAGRIDYLESVCAGINAYRGEIDDTGN